MHTKTLKILGIIFVVFAALTWLLIDRDKNEENNNEFALAIGFAEFTSTITDEIVIEKEGTSLVLEKENSTWSLDGREVHQEEIDSFFDILHELRVQSLASKNKDNHSKFQVTEEDGMKLQFRQGEEEQTFIIGKRGVDRETFYARHADKTNVHLMNGDLLSYLAREASDWTGGLEVISQDPGVIQKVTVQDSYNVYMYGIDPEGNWAVVKNSQFSPLAENRQKNLETMTTHITAENELGDAEKQEFSEIARKITVTMSDKSGVTQETFRITKSGTAWWIELDEKLYSVSQDIFSNIIGW